MVEGVSMFSLQQTILLLVFSPESHTVSPGERHWTLSVIPDLASERFVFRLQLQQHLQFRLQFRRHFPRHCSHHRWDLVLMLNLQTSEYFTRSDTRQNEQA